MLWHEQTWKQISELPRQLPVVVPLGSCEQHGEHLPLFVDSIQVQAVAERVDQRMGRNVMTLPTLWLGSSHHHKDFAGTISVRPSLYEQMIAEVTRSIMHAGFRRIFFLNGHGGNEIPATNALAELVALEDQADDSYLCFASWWQVGKEALRPERHGMKAPEITHACEYETSFMLFLRPDLVQMDRARANEPVLNSVWHRSDLGRRVKMFRRFHRLTPTGSMGDPTVASTAKGQGMLEGVVNEIVTFLEEFPKWPELAPIGART
jgi:creatinine amidohydrolase